MHSDRIRVYTVTKLNLEEILVKSGSDFKLEDLKERGFILEYNLQSTVLRKGFDFSKIDVDIDKIRTVKELHKIFVLDTYLRS